LKWEDVVATLAVNYLDTPGSSNAFTTLDRGDALMLHAEFFDVAVVVVVFSLVKFDVTDVFLASIGSQVGVSTGAFCF
jgi:hypothetical protein